MPNWKKTGKIETDILSTEVRVTQTAIDVTDISSACVSHRGVRLHMDNKVLYEVSDNSLKEKPGIYFWPSTFAVSSHILSH